MSGTNANRGKPFETTVEAMNALYAARGACYVRFPTPYKVIGRTRAGLSVVPERKGQPDYLVSWRNLDVVADAKSTTAARWALSNLEAHQAEFFDAWARTGDRHRAGIILSLHPPGGGQSVWWVDWSQLGPVWRRWNSGHAQVGDASLSLAWLEEHARRVVGMDWFGVVR